MLISMGLYYVLSLFMLVLLSEICVTIQGGGPTFNQNYHVYYGYDHVSFGNQGRDVQLSLDSTTGAGFESKSSYKSGVFQMNIKPPAGDTAGVVTTFYLISERDDIRDEIDFEFLGNRKGKPTILQTNIFKDGKGEREERFKLWFDPTQGYHSYKIIWNQHQIVFFVDNTPIRVFKNRGGNIPTKPMKVKATIWNGDSWATDGGREKINWGASPFRAHYQGFNIGGCSSSNGGDCSASHYWWNRGEYLELSPQQERLYNQAKKYMAYNYCDDKSKHHTSTECE